MDEPAIPATVKVGDFVRITCPASHYHGVVGEVYEIQEPTQYAVVDMPKGTELMLENITENKILKEMKRAAKTRKTPIKRMPKGDPQWFPLRWLEPVTPESTK
jgi:hypothetical protein